MYVHAFFKMCDNNGMKKKTKTLFDEIPAMVQFLVYVQLIILIVYARLTVNCKQSRTTFAGE